MAPSTTVPFALTDAALVPVPSRRTMRVAGVFSTAALLLLVIWSWAPGLQDERDDTRSSAPASGRVLRHRDPGVTAAEKAGLNVDRAVEQASHTPLPVAGSAGALEVVDRAYRATFDNRGFSYAPTGETASFNVALSGVQRGDSRVALRSGTWAADHNAAVRQLAPGLSERVTTRSGEVEWDVVLGSPPAGRGDLRITAGLDGMTGAPTRVDAKDGPAWRFALDGGGSVQLDELVVKDASGAVLHRALPRVEGDRVFLDVPGSVLDHAAYPVTVDPTVNGPYPVSGEGFNPAVAFDGTNYLVVWEQQFGGDSDILGARLNGSGGFLSGPFLVSSAANNETHADVAWNGSSYLVVWEFRNSGAAPLDDYDLKGQRLNASGGLLGANFHVYGSSFSDRRWDSRHPSVAADGVDFFVAWDDNANFSALGWDVYGKTISGTGAVGFGTRYAGNAKSETFPDVAWNGATYLIVYTFEFSSTDLDVWGQQVDPYNGLQLSDGTFNGQAFQSNFSISSPVLNQIGPSVASENSNPTCQLCHDPPSIGGPFLVTWGDATSGTTDVYGVMINSVGSVGSKFPIATGPRDQTTMPKSIAYNGEYYLVAWLDITQVGSAFPRGVYAARVGRTGNVLDPNGFKVADSAAIEMAPAVSVGSGNQWGVAYQIDTAIELRRVSPK